jgi:hypothetical protein
MNVIGFREGHNTKWAEEVIGFPDVKKKGKFQPPENI